MTKYEKARIIGTRALQISKNAPVMIHLGKGFCILLKKNLNIYNLFLQMIMTLFLLLKKN